MWPAEKVACYWDEVDPCWNIFLDGHVPMNASIENTYPAWLFVTVRHGEAMAQIQIDGANSCWLYQNKS